RQDLQTAAARPVPGAGSPDNERVKRMSGICDGRVVIITGAAGGIGRGPAGEVVEEIRGMGGEAYANGDDVSDWEGAQRLINTAIEQFGRLDVLVNNAGILRDRMLVNMTEEEWDA